MGTFLVASPKSSHLLPDRVIELELDHTVLVRHLITEVFNWDKNVEYSHVHASCR